MESKRLYLAIGIILLTGFVTVTIRLLNIDMTETRLFIEYWEWFVLCIVLNLAAIWIVVK